ncbi:kinesin-like protein KIN-12F [Malania oleifera]|uniref:kinesin-like protein KIN-12F n=1 Tax=Malania oleifera TaxID=397392 RepID=UPI0025ADB61E|nr:kinesin-like protein KIN-12F [Malania oleifera]
MKSNTEISENRFMGSISASSLRNLLPKKYKSKSNSVRAQSISDTENTPPIDPNIPDAKIGLSTSISKKSPPEMLNAVSETAKTDGRLEVSPPTDPPVKVVVRIRPPNDRESEGGRIAMKASSDVLLVGDRKFSFDSVFDSNSTQDNIFQLVGAPLVKNALAGFNTSILSYGQTGSGKTYTMWGPPSAMLEGHSANGHQGIVPRIFQMLFSEIQREQENSEGKLTNYQCRCSFLEIYNEQIGDLLDPTQRNLEIKDDAKNGFYVENLTEEYVTSYEDVTQILIKGLSSRKVGATSINSKSSRSHIVFSFVIESWCKGNSSNCFSSSKTSRINLVDLAGLERNRFDDASRQHAKESKNVKKTLSQLGHLVNILAKGTQYGTPEDVPYKNSCLTHLLRESLGGNAKLTVICAISSDNRSTGETLSTLRFGQRAKSIHNEPVINEITEDDVNDLSDQIRQLKEELIRAKSSTCNSVGSNGYFKGRNVRKSLNQLRVSLNRSLILPRFDNDSEEVVPVDECDVRELHMQLDNLQSSSKENPSNLSDKRNSFKFHSVEESSEADMSEHEISCIEESETEEVNTENPGKKLTHEEDVASVRSLTIATNESSSCQQAAVLQDPTLSESPKFSNAQRKSTVLSSNFLASQNNVLESSKLDIQSSIKQCDHIRSLRSSKIFPGPTESLAASLQRGLQIIDYHQQQSTSNKSSVAFSFENLTFKPCSEVDKPNASIQTLLQEGPDQPSASFLCASCQQRGFNGTAEVEDSLKTWIVSEEKSQNPNASIDQLPKGARRNLAEAINRERELETVCAEQAAKIEELNRLVQRYRNEREHTFISEQGQISDSLLLEPSKKEIIPVEGLQNEEYHSLKNETKLLGCNYDENQPEMITEKFEIKEVLEGVDYDYRSTSFDINEREALLKEIRTLRSKLQSYTDAFPNKSTEKLRSSLMSQSIHLCASRLDSHTNNEELERERQRWTEMESDWISLTDELRVDLESHRRHAEKVEMELRSEKKCSEELDDALQRSVLGHARMVEHYAELQEKHNDLLENHWLMMEGIAEVKRAAAKAGAKGNGSRFAKALTSELSALRVERERERAHLKRENKSLRIQLKDTAEAVHAAGELLVRLREAEEASSIAEENFMKGQQENEKLKKQIEKMKRKHKMEMITMKQYLAESRLPESALPPLYREDSDTVHNNTISTADDDQAWRAEFGAIYQEHY